MPLRKYFFKKLLIKGYSIYSFGFRSCFKLRQRNTLHLHGFPAAQKFLQHRIARNQIHRNGATGRKRKHQFSHAGISRTFGVQCFIGLPYKGCHCANFIAERSIQKQVCLRLKNLNKTVFPFADSFPHSNGFFRAVAAEFVVPHQTAGKPQVPGRNGTLAFQRVFLP